VPRLSVRADISGLLDVQCGVVRRDQVVGTALTDGTLRWLLRTRRWQAVLPSVYACFTGQVSDDQRTVAAQLYCGPDAQLTGPGALRAHEMRYAPHDERVHMLVPHACHVSSAAFVVVHRTRRPDPHPAAHGVVRVASVARAVADTARICTDIRTVRAFVAESVQSRLTTVPALVHELDSGPRRGSALLRQVVEEVADGIRSAPEAQLREIAEESAVLPAVHWNPALTTISGEALPTPDGWIDDAGIALEVDSREHHATPDGWTRTLHRHNVLASHGALVLHFTPRELYTEPDSVRRVMVESYLERLRTGARASIRLFRGQGVPQVVRTIM
jgi:hypothetical protein